MAQLQRPFHRAGLDVWLLRYRFTGWNHGHQAHPSPVPYARGLTLYRAEGWAGVIPLTKGKKTPAAVGVTGYHDAKGNPSHWPTTEEYDRCTTFLTDSDPEAPAKVGLA